MTPSEATQIKWGAGVALLCVLVVAILALVPDPFFRQRVLATTLDDVEGVSPGVQIFFRGAPIGAVRSVTLDGSRRTFLVNLGVDRHWQPSACSFATISSTNPLTAPHVELVALENTGASCDAARAAYGCSAIAGPVGADAITGCRRPPDLIETAAIAVTEAAAVAKTANAMAQRLAGSMQGDGKGGAVDMVQVARNATETLAALNSLTTRLDASFAPGRGDIALTLAHVRDTTGRAAQIDVNSLNGVLRETRALVAQNQANIAGLLAEGKSSAGEVRMILEGASASLVATSANLERTSQNLGALSERLSADPTYLIRGQKLADPPGKGQ